MRTGCYRQSYQEDVIRTVRERLFFVSVCVLQLYATVRYGTAFSRQKGILYPPALLISVPVHDTLVKKHILSHVMDAEHHPPSLVEMRH